MESALDPQSRCSQRQDQVSLRVLRLEFHLAVIAVCYPRRFPGGMALDPPQHGTVDRSRRGDACRMAHARRVALAPTPEGFAGSVALTSLSVLLVGAERR